MATVDIEPTSLAVTPGESQTLTLTIGNDGNDIEAYHLTVVDDAAAYVVITPDTLLVRPGETVTAEATVTLEHTGRWRLGDLIVRFHIVPAGRPEEFVVVEAIATIQSFSDVTAVLSPPDLEGRRGAAAEVMIANAGNAPTYAVVSATAGELALFIDKPRAALPADSAESVGLTVRTRSLLWRGEPVQHPFLVTVAPEGGQAISVGGTFTQLPVFARWALAAAISVGAVAVAALLVWLGAVVVGGAAGTSAASTSPATTSPTETETPPPEPDVRMAITATVDDAKRAGDPVVFSIEPAIDDAPPDSLLAMEVQWPEGLLLTADECEAWIAPGSEGVLEGRPQSGDECIIELSGGQNDAELTFATPPEGFAGAVSARAARLVTLDDDEATTLETGPGSDFGTLAADAITLAAYSFWMEVVDLESSDGGPDAKVIIHHGMRGDGTDREATMAFEIATPAFVDGIFDTDQCDDRQDSTCFVFFGSNADVQSNTTREIDVWFDPDDAVGVGPLSVTGTSLTDVPSNEVDRWIRGAEGLLVSAPLFPVNVSVDLDQEPGQEASVSATIDVSAIELPAAYAEGSWELGLKLAWPEGLVLDGMPVGCELADDVCTLRGPLPGKPVAITMKFDVDDSFDPGEFRASGATLDFDPTTAADRRDGRTRTPISLPPHWIGSNAEWIEF